MTKVLKGKPVADVLAERVTRRLAAANERRAGEGKDPIAPLLVLLSVGEDGGSASYERSLVRRAESMGIAVDARHLPEDTDDKTMLETIAGISDDPLVHGCMVFQPLPGHLHPERFMDALDPAKDVDGATRASLFGVFSGESVGYPPATAEACIRILEYYGQPLEGERVTVVGRSLVVGRPVAMLAMERNATVTLCHSRTQDIAAHTEPADVAIIAAGRPRMLGASDFGSKTVVIDVGTTWDENEGRLVGDVDFDSVEGHVHAITPVPGGVGAVTPTVLCAHVIESALKAAGE